MNWSRQNLLGEYKKGKVVGNERIELQTMRKEIPIQTKQPNG